MSRQLNWVNIGWLFLSPVTAAIVVPIFLWHAGFTWSGLAWFVAACFLSSFGITAGYHRLFAHRSYEASPVFKGFLLLAGAGNFQGSALQWAADHRRHHRYVDSDNDPYSISKGFWYAHIGWLFHEDVAGKKDYPKDLTNDPLIMFQDRYYVWIAIATGFLVPWGIGFLVGSPMGGLFIGGLARIVFCQHCTFLINSLSHYMGRQTYTLKNSARDNLLMAFLAYGEGWHSFHHRFQSDYRNGFRWYHWDPTKWLIGAMSWVGQASRLKTVPDSLILQARMQTEEARLVSIGVSEDRLTALKHRFEAAQTRARALYVEYKAEYNTFKKRMGDHERVKQAKLKLAHMRAEIKIAKLERKMAFQQWCAYVRTMRRAVPAYR